MQEPSIGILSILILISSAQCLFFSIVFFFMRKGNRRANLFLAALSLAMSILLVDGFMNATNYYGRYPQLIGAAWPVYYLVGPFFYFYVRELSSLKRMVFSWRQSLYFLPAIVSGLLPILFYRMSEYENVPTLLYLIAPMGTVTFPTLNAVPQLVILQNAVYSVLSYRLIRDYRSGIKQRYSSLDKSNLSLLRAMLISFICLIFLIIFLLYFAASLGIHHRQSTYIFYLIWSGANFVSAFKAVFNPEIYSWIAVAHQVKFVSPDPDMVTTATAPDKPPEDIETLSKDKYQRTLLSDARTAEIARQLLQFMETEKPYLKPELALSELADKLSVFPHHLSQVINREMEKSFFDFVNEYRVKEAKRLLSSPQYSHFSVLGIALDAGFNSKSAFYTAFGKYAGMTPSQFRKQLARSVP